MKKLLDTSLSKTADLKYEELKTQEYLQDVSGRSQSNFQVEIKDPGYKMSLHMEVFGHQMPDMREIG